jgi:hypothetical protein
MAQITLIEGVTMALAHEMAKDPSVVVLGEDVGINGGVFRATAGLLEKFGADRIIDTPLDELTIAGLTVGLAAQGMKLHLSDDGTHRLPCCAHAHAHARSHDLPRSIPRALGRRNPRARASLRGE